jgi:hypothetical protein
VNAQGHFPIWQVLKHSPLFIAQNTSTSGKQYISLNGAVSILEQVTKMIATAMMIIGSLQCRK